MIMNLSGFDPKYFIGRGWAILSNETDAHSFAHTKLALTKIEFITMLRDGETCVSGEEKLKRLKASDYIRLDAGIFFALWENQHVIPGSWKEKVNGKTRYILFDGTIFLSPDGDRCVMSLYWDGGQWCRLTYCLWSNLHAHHLSAVLPK
jgi:hypothetical protein